MQKATSIIDFNHDIDGVNPAEQQLDSLDVLWNSYKWYKKVFLRQFIQYALVAHKLHINEESIIFFKMHVPYSFRMH